MILTRRSVLATPLLLPALVAIPPGSRTGIGVSSYSIRTRLEPAFRDPARFVSHCRALGAGGVQLPIGIRGEAEADRLRRIAEEAGLVLEGSTRPPDPDDPADLDRFDAELGTASRAGATVVRTVMLGGRRYETFDSAEAFGRFRERSLRSLRRAAPLLERHGVGLAVENHKDFRAVELLDLLDRAGSDRIGVCVDLGNNLALLEDPAETVRALAPRAMTCHLKDMAVEESSDGFLLSEVPLGLGMLDLPRLVSALRSARPDCRFMLEMITRDPLRVPCLAEPYWATLGDLPARDLARTLATVRARASSEPLPRVEHLPPEGQMAAEEANVRACLGFAERSLGL